MRSGIYPAQAAQASVRLPPTLEGDKPVKHSTHRAWRQMSFPIITKSTYIKMINFFNQSACL